MPRHKKFFPNEKKAYYQLSNNDDFKSLTETLSENYRVELIHQRDSELREKESLFVVAPVAVLRKNCQSKHIFGVFAQEDIKISSKLRVGEYIGQLVARQRAEKKKYDTDFTFDINKEMMIDAKHQRSWPAMVNATSCYEASNVEAIAINNRVYYYLTRSIKQGHQLLIYYGDEYNFEDKRFLNPNNNWKESEDIVEEHKNIYSKVQTTDQAFINLFELKSSILAVPNINLFHRITADIDLPILVYQNSRDILAPQYDQENITGLMLACWQGNDNKVAQFLDKNANIYQQTSRLGLSPLHILIKSPYCDTEKKITILDQILSEKYRAIRLQDKQDKTILHYALEDENVKLVEYLLNYDVKISRYDREHISILDYLDDHDEDAILLSIRASNDIIVKRVVSHIRLSDFDILFKNSDSLINSLSIYLNKNGLKALKKRVELISETIPNAYNDEKETLLSLINKAFFPSEKKRKHDDISSKEDPEETNYRSKRKFK